MKRTVKRLLQSGVASVAPFAWRLGAPSLLVLMYHRVLPDDHPDRANEQPGMFVSPQTLRMHLDVIREHFTFVHLGDWIDAVERRSPVPRRACAVTFDDGWRDNFQHAFPVLRDTQVPATIFLVSDLVGTSYSFWPNLLARLLKDYAGGARGRLPEWLAELIDEHATRAGSIEAMTDSVIDACKARRTDVEMYEALRSAGELPRSESDRDLMNWDEVREMQASGLVRFGSHTRRHTRLLDSLDRPTLEDEILESRKEIARNIGVEPDLFCYPNGDFSPAAVGCVRSVYRGAVTTKPGWNRCDADRVLLRRVGVHEDVSSTRAAFLSRLAGVG